MENRSVAHEEEAAGSSETSVSNYQTTRRHILEHHSLHIHCSKSLKSHMTWTDWRSITALSWILRFCNREFLYQPNNLVQTSHVRSYMVHFPFEFLPWVSLRDFKFVRALCEHEFRYTAAPLSCQCHSLIVKSRSALRWLQDTRKILLKNGIYDATRKVLW